MHVAVSALVSGDDDAVFKALGAEMGRSFEDDRRAVFVMKVIGTP